MAVLENADGETLFSFANAGDRQMTRNAETENEKIVTAVSASFHILRLG